VMPRAADAAIVPRGGQIRRTGYTRLRCAGFVRVTLVEWIEHIVIIVGA
jgi:hypothetical protein